MNQKKKLSRKVLSYVLALVMVISTMTGIVPGMSLKAYAAPAETLLTTITPTGIDTYSESTKGVVNVTLSGISTYDNGRWRKGGTVTVTQKEGYTITKCRFITRESSVDDSEAPFSYNISASTYVSSIEVYGYQGSPKTAQTVTAPTAATGLTYKKDQAQALLTSGASVTTGNTATGSIQYKVGADGTWSTEIPKGTNAGNYDVYYKVLGDETYAEYAPTTPITVTIAKADPVTPTGITAKYGDDTGKIKLPEGWTWNYWHYFGTVGKDTVKADFAGNDNYNNKTGVDITVEVGKADVAISYEKTEVSIEYGAEFGKNEITNPGNAEPTFTSSKESVATVSDSGYVTIKGLGETTITATIKDNAHYHYTTTEASYKLTVNPVTTAVTTAPTAAELTYGQKLSESTLTGGVAVSHGRSVAGTFAWKEPNLVPNASDNGEYDVVFTPTDTNCGKSTCKVTIKVNKKTVSVKDLEDAQKPVAKTGDDVVYTGEPIELVTAPTADLPLDYEAFYSTDDGDSWSKDIPKKTDPGTYTVKVKYVSKGGNCNDIILDDITATITPADKKALTDAITVAKAYYDTIKGNTDYSEAADKLDKAIKAAEEVAAKNKLTKSEVSTAAEALNTAKATAEAGVKDIDDTVAAKKVTDAINALPASDKVATTDKAAIEAARKAYDALTADQKKKVPADVLKKLTDAEVALKAAEAAEKAAKELEAAKKEAQAAMNEQVTVKQKGNKFTVKWKKSSAADGYYVYASYCGKKATKPAKTVKKNTTTKVTISKINGKKIKQKKNFHVYVVPYKIIDGKKVKLAKSTVAHLVGAKSTKYSNVKKLTLKKKKYTVKVGKTAKIKAKVTLVNKNKKHIPKGHGAKFRYKSSDTSIATVDKNGKIKGIKKGKCTIYVYSINGLTKKAKITVK